MESLPHEIIELIFSYLSAHEFVAARAVCKAWSLVRYPHAVSYLNIGCDVRIFRKVIYDTYQSHFSQIQRIKKKSIKAEDTVVTRDQLEGAEIVYVPMTCQSIDFGPSVRYVMFNGGFNAPQVRWTDNIRYLFIRSSAVELRGSFLPPCLETLNVSYIELADEPLPHTITRLYVAVIRYQCHLHEGLRALDCVGFARESVYQLPSTLESLSVYNIQYDNLRMNDSLKHLECTNVYVELTLPAALQSFKGCLKPNMHFPPTLRKAIIQFERTMLSERLVGAFHRNITSLELVISVSVLHGLFMPGSIPPGLVNLVLTINYVTGGELFARGVLPASLRRLSLWLCTNNDTGEHVVHVNNLPDALWELRLDNARSAEALVNYPPNIRVLHSNFMRTIPDSVETWQVQSNALGAYVPGPHSRLKYVRLAKWVGKFQVPPTVRLSYS